MTKQTKQLNLEERIREVLKLKISLKYDKDILNLKDTPEGLAESQKIVDNISELLFNPVKDLLKAERKDLVDKLDQLSMCMGNEWSEEERYGAVRDIKRTLTKKL